MKRRYWILAALLLALLSGPACALGGFLEQVGLGQRTDDPSLMTDAPARSVPTLYPTATPRPSPTATSPSDKDAFRLEMTETDLAEFVDEQGFGQQGLRIRDLDVRITEQNVIATFNATHSDSGLSGEITVVAVPQVVNGKLYLQIADYSLGQGFSGFRRAIANAFIRSAIENINTAHGIPIPIGGVAELTSVELYDGMLVINGRLDAQN